MVRFVHDIIETTTIEQVTTDKGRVYVTPQGTFPSVTTVLNHALDDSALRAWRDRMGKEADQISARAQARGTAVHAIAERYLRNEDWRAGAMPSNLMTFEMLRPFLDAHVGRVWGIEHRVWSKRLQTAGSIDLFCEWDGQPAIVDFKTSAKTKTLDSPAIRRYLLQTATYAIMASEGLGINTRRLVLLFCPDDAPAGHAITRDRAEFEPAVEAIFSPRNRDRLAIPVVDTRGPGVVLLGGNGGVDETVRAGEERVD